MILSNVFLLELNAFWEIHCKFILNLIKWIKPNLKTESDVVVRTTSGKHFQTVPYLRWDLGSRFVAPNFKAWESSLHVSSAHCLYSAKLSISSKSGLTWGGTQSGGKSLVRRASLMWLLCVMGGYIDHPCLFGCMPRWYHSCIEGGDVNKNEMRMLCVRAEGWGIWI